MKKKFNRGDLFESLNVGQIKVTKYENIVSLDHNGKNIEIPCSLVGDLAFNLREYVHPGKFTNGQINAIQKHIGHVPEVKEWIIKVKKENSC